MTSWATASDSTTWARCSTRRPAPVRGDASRQPSSRTRPTAAPICPTSPHPIPQELATHYTEAYWHSLAWRQTTWLGTRVPRPPTDLFAYQELVNKLRPEWIIDIRAGAGGRAWFLATVCDLVG